MALSLANCITETRYLLNEATAAFFTDAEITQWIKEGVRVLSSKGLLYETTVDLTLVANQISYAATDVLEVSHAYYKNTAGGAGNYKGLIKSAPNKIGNLATKAAGIPKYYCQWGRNIYVWPLPTAAVVTAGGTIQLFCSKETDDVTAINDEYQHMAILYAAAKGKQKDQKFTEAAALFTQYYADLDFERKDKIDREEDALSDFKVLPARAQGGQRA
jgi:hypothetical protein